MDFKNAPDSSELFHSDIQHALSFAEGIRQQIHTMGANDSEFSSINDIVQRVKRGALTSAEAILELQSVRDSKQDYH